MALSITCKLTPCKSGPDHLPVPLSVSLRSCDKQKVGFEGQGQLRGSLLPVLEERKEDQCQTASGLSEDQHSEAASD